MPSEWRTPEPPKIDRFVETLDHRLRLETLAYRRAFLPPQLVDLIRKLRVLAKPIAQSGAMALTALVIIVAISATPAARLGTPLTPGSAPLAAPDHEAIVNSDISLFDYLPPGDVQAIRVADNLDITPGDSE
ncbi:MAG: hypothetical protein WEF28_10310 [Acidimicrobiia bacterium]